MTEDFELEPKDTDTLVTLKSVGLEKLGLDNRLFNGACEVFNDLYHTIDRVNNHYQTKR